MGGSGGKGIGDWAMLASNPVQAVVPELFGIRDWDPISSGFAQLTGKIAGEDTSGYSLSYLGGPGYHTSVERQTKEMEDAWADYYKRQAEAWREQIGKLRGAQGAAKTKAGETVSVPRSAGSAPVSATAAGRKIFPSLLDLEDEKTGSLITK